eukprot:scaffold18100_cov149-Isochrysis_galbana.AAC.3
MQEAISRTDPVALDSPASELLLFALHLRPTRCPVLGSSILLTSVGRQTGRSLAGSNFAARAESEAAVERERGARRTGWRARLGALDNEKNK